jgi:uncharacterized protein
MLLVKTYLDRSPIHGVGLFAEESIPKGTVVWEFNPLIDIILTQEQFEQLPEPAKQFIYDHAYPFPIGADNYCLSLDRDQYMNHSLTPNVVDQDKKTSIAAKDIEKSMELTCNYYPINHRITESSL